jgi:hypothetical protein
VFGDGIAHVLATSTGQVWAGYFDDGIYGNYGWGRADSEEPVGAYGIVRFSPDLEPGWHYPKYPEVGPWDAISDCYAVTGRHNDIKGASALAVSGSRVALFGGYGPDYDRLAVTTLDAEHARADGEYRIVLPDGEPLAPGTQVIGRDRACTFLTGSNRYQLDAGDIPQ